MNSFNLHLEHEKNFTIVNPQDSSICNRNEIQLTYKKALEVILESSQDEFFNDFDFGLHKNLIYKYKVVGAAVDKFWGFIHLFILSKDINTDTWDGIKLEWHPSHNTWKNSGSTFLKKERNVHIPYKHFLQDGLIQNIFYSKKQIHNRDPIFIETILNQPNLDETNTINGKRTCAGPIEEYDQKTFSSHTYFTINYQDIFNQFYNIKNARNIINFEKNNDLKGNKS